jgi:hypothetical protein
MKSLLESADGSMATVATRREKKLVQRKNNGTYLTPTGLLMEGDFTNLAQTGCVNASLSCSTWPTSLRPRIVAVTVALEFFVFKRSQCFIFCVVNMREDERTDGCFFKIRGKKH